MKAARVGIGGSQNAVADALADTHHHGLEAGGLPSWRGAFTDRTDGRLGTPGPANPHGHDLCSWAFAWGKDALLTSGDRTQIVPSLIHLEIRISTRMSLGF